MDWNDPLVDDIREAFEEEKWRRIAGGYAAALTFLVKKGFSQAAQALGVLLASEAKPEETFAEILAERERHRLNWEALHSNLSNWPSLARERILSDVKAAKEGLLLETLT